MPSVINDDAGGVRMRMQKLHDAGHIAGEILLKRLIEPDARVPESTIMPMSIIERNSIAPPRPSRGRKSRAARKSRILRQR